MIYRYTKGSALTHTELDSNLKELVDDVSKLDNTKHDRLVSGTNIKTINGVNILGQGDIDLTGILNNFPYANTSSLVI